MWPEAYRSASLPDGAFFSGSVWTFSPCSRWAPSVGAWQRQLTDNAIRAADRLECIKPLSGEKPSQLQKKPSILQTMREQGEKVQTEPEKKAPSGRDAER